MWMPPASRRAIQRDLRRRLRRNNGTAAAVLPQRGSWWQSADPASNRIIDGTALAIARQAQRAFAAVHPDIVRGCRTLGIERAELDVLAPQPWLNDFPVERPLRLATGPLIDQCREILKSARFQASDIQSLHLFFRPVPGKGNQSTEVTCSLELADGRVFVRTMPVGALSGRRLDGKTSASR